MTIEKFLSKTRGSLGYLYAKNGYYFDSGSVGYGSPARADLTPLCELLKNTDSPIDGVMLYGSAVKRPVIKILYRRKYWLWGPIVSKRQLYTHNVRDFDIIVFQKDTQNKSIEVPAFLTLVDYDADTIVVSGYHVLFISQDEFKRNVEQGNSVCSSAARDGVMLFQEKPAWKLGPIGNPDLSVEWSVSNNGRWKCQVAGELKPIEEDSQQIAGV
jgi:hypothetical protein